MNGYECTVCHRGNLTHLEFTFGRVHEYCRYSHRRPIRTESAEKDFLTVGPASAILNVPTESVTKLEKDGRITCCRDDNGHRLFRRQDLERLRDQLAEEAAQKDPESAPLVKADH